MSENYGLKMSCGRHGIVGCERCFGSYRVVRPRVRRTELDELQAERDSLVASLEATKPCEPCQRDDHDNCTGYCSSMCCALAAAERERDSLPPPLWPPWKRREKISKSQKSGPLTVKRRFVSTRTR